MFGSQAHDHGLGIKPVSDVCFCDMTVNMSPTNYNDSKLDWKKDRHFYATSSLRLFILKNTFSFAENEISGFFKSKKKHSRYYEFSDFKAVSLWQDPVFAPKLSLKSKY